ncbi:hypothetical protein AAVH_17237 [Aphelenchoides avenae]|nr:hypothetical protein AAVH_17237 [Aphelenchus avenae]
MSDCLEGCHLYLCGYADAALPKYKTLVRKVGATLSYEQLDAQVTHILVSTAPLDPQTTEMLKNPPGEVPVLTARWLLDCATHSDKPRRLAVDAYLYEAQTKLVEDARAAGASVKKPLNARNTEDSSLAQKNRPIGGALGSADAAGTQSVPETQAWRPAKSSIFQRQSSTLGSAVNENTSQSDEPSSRTTTATTVAAAYPSTVSSSDTMTTASSIGTAWTEVGRLGGRSTVSNALTLGLNRETTTPERMDCSDPSTEVQTLGGRTTTSKTLTLGLDLEVTTPEQMDSADPTLSTSNANEQTPKQSTPLAMNSRVAMLRFSECGTRRSSIASVHNTTMDSMNLSHSPTAYLTGKFPFKLRLKRLGEAEQHLRDMPTPQGSPHTSTDSLSVSAVGRLLAQAVVNTGRGLEQQAEAQVPDNTDEMEVDADVNNGNEEADNAASTVTAVEPAVVAEPASPSRNRRAPNRLQHSPVKEKPSTPKKRARTPKKTPKSPARPTPSPNTDRLDDDDEEVFECFFEATNTATAVESAASVEPASSSRKRGRPRKKVVQSSTEETSPEANPKPKRQRTARKKQL